ncbi:MAG: hypothetical protein R2813_02285 [Flavobacteriales bacterium]
MKNVIFFLLGLLSLQAAAQQYGPTNDSLYLGFRRDSIANLNRPTVLIAPFHPSRYLSEFDHDIAKGTNYTYQHTRGFFRKGLDNSILIAAKEFNNYVNLHADDPALNHDLDFVYKVVAPQVVPYEPPVIKEDQKFKARLANYWEKLQTNVEQAPDPGTRIEQGQIVSVADHRELITKANIFNPIIFDSLVPKHDVDYFLFINEMNMLNAAGNQQAYESDNYQRVIKVHYSVFDAQGNELFSLVKKRYFSSYQNDLPSIIKEEILPIGYEIMYSIDSYRFLKAGLEPIKLEEDKKSLGLNLPELPTLRKNRE